MKLFSGNNTSTNVAKQLRQAMGERVEGNYRAEPFSSNLSCQIAIETWEHHGQNGLVKLAKKFAKGKGWLEREG